MALALSLGYSAHDLVQFYLTKGQVIFPRGGPIRRCYRGIQSLLSPRYNVEPFITVLKQYFENWRLGDARVRLVIPAFNPATGDIYLFKTAHHSRFSSDYKIMAWEIARATCAAPTYFRAYRKGLATDLIDGGMWANNPAMVGLTEALGPLNQQPENIALLSVGTSVSDVSVNPHTRQKGGAIRWSMTIARDLFMHIQAVVADHQVFHILERGCYVRIDANRANVTIPLDDTLKAQELIPFGEQAARHAYPKLASQFFDLKATRFVPYY
jgi:hypothetical protein